MTPSKGEPVGVLSLQSSLTVQSTYMTKSAKNGSREKITNGLPKRRLSPTKHLSEPELEISVTKAAKQFANFSKNPLGPQKRINRNRSEVQGSTFRVKGKEGIEYPQSSLNMVILSSNCQFGSKFWIRPVEDNAFFINTRSKCSPGMKMEP